MTTLDERAIESMLDQVSMQTNSPAQRFLQEAEQGEVPPHPDVADVQRRLLMESTPNRIVTVYMTQTGDAREVSASSLHYILRQFHTLPDGTTVPVFQMEPVPGDQIPVQQSFKCRLHKDDPDRATWDSMGMAYCKKERISNPYNVELHMKTVHPSEELVIAAEMQRRENAQLRERMDAATDRNSAAMEMIAQGMMAIGDLRTAQSGRPCIHRYNVAGYCISTDGCQAIKKGSPAALAIQNGDPALPFDWKPESAAEADDG